MSSQTPSRVLALDPGFERLGVAVLEKGDSEKLLWSECFTTPRVAFPERLKRIGEHLEALIEKYEPDSLALEKLYFNTNQKTAMDVAAVRGIILYLGAHRNLSVSEYTPSQIKVAVAGNGHAEKRDVEAMVKRLVHLAHPVAHDDEYDAIAVGLTHLAHARYPQR